MHAASRHGTPSLPSLPKYGYEKLLLKNLSALVNKVIGNGFNAYLQEAYSFCIIVWRIGSFCQIFNWISSFI